MIENRIYLIYDGRARYCNTDAATVMEVCNSLLEAHRARTDYGDDAIIFSYKLEGGVAVDERMEES